MFPNKYNCRNFHLDLRSLNFNFFIDFHNTVSFSVEKKITGNYANSNLVQDMHLSLLPIFLPITIILVNW